MEELLQDVVAPAPVVLLASRSPRRRALLDEAGIRHTAEHPGFEDSVLVPGAVGPEQWVAALAYLKAWVKWRELAQRVGVAIPRWVLGADTACVAEGRLIGTPHSRAEAEQMLRSFSGRSHEVITGVAIIDVVTGEREVFSDRARVHVGELTDAQILPYLESGDWAGKAGGYNLSERVAAGWPITWDGDAGTIMGLPVRNVSERLRSRGAA